MALVDLGADVAFAAGRHGDRVRISARSSRAAVRTGLNLNELLGEVGRAHERRWWRPQGCSRPGGQRRAPGPFAGVQKKSGRKAALMPSRAFSSGLAHPQGCLLQGLNARQWLAGEIGDARASAHAHMGELGLQAELLDGRHTVPAARNGVV